MAAKSDRIVIKVGTSTLTNELGNSNLRTMEKLAMVLSDIQNMGHEVILVSSGAIAVGANKMHLKEKPTTMRMKQAAAAVGQCANMFLYDKFFGYYDKTVAQILLNAEDITQEEKKENLSNTFAALLEQGVIPIVNENDSVSYTEIESEERLFSDNDVLSAVVAVLCQADKLVILSDIDGLTRTPGSSRMQSSFPASTGSMTTYTGSRAARVQGAARAACAPNSRRRTWPRRRASRRSSRMAKTPRSFTGS